MHDALARELREVGDYLGAIEHSFSENGVTQHEVNHLFEVTLPNVRGTSPLRSLEPHLEFFWHPVNNLMAVALRPELVVEFLGLPGSRARWALTLSRAPGVA